MSRHSVLEPHVLWETVLRVGLVARVSRHVERLPHILLAVAVFVFSEVLAWPYIPASGDQRGDWRLSWDLSAYSEGEFGWPLEVLALGRIVFGAGGGLVSLRQVETFGGPEDCPAGLPAALAVSIESLKLG